MSNPIANAIEYLMEAPPSPQVTAALVELKRAVNAPPQAVQEPHEAGTPAPDWDDLRGVAPDATGDLSSEQFIRQMRDGWHDEPVPLREAVAEWLVDRTPTDEAEKRLAATYVRAFPDEFGKENCTCGEQATCDECPSQAEILSSAALALAAAPKPEKPAPFAIGNPVQKVKGYLWPGEVRSVFTNKAGDTRIVVECTVPEVAGALHIYSPEQIAASPRAPADGGK